jgi:transposase InsO family protein
MNGLIGIAKLFGKLDDARRKLALWRYDYNNIGPHSSLEYKTPAEARRALLGGAHPTRFHNPETMTIN